MNESLTEKRSISIEKSLPGIRYGTTHYLLNTAQPRPQSTLEASTTQDNLSKSTAARLAQDESEEKQGKAPKKEIASHSFKFARKVFPLFCVIEFHYPFLFLFLFSTQDCGHEDLTRGRRYRADSTFLEAAS